MNTLYTEGGRHLAENPGIIPWDRYPRPQMVRESWLNLNGWWELDDASADGPAKIRIPFCPESLLSGVQRTYPQGAHLTYQRTFIIPESYQGQRLLLHFGAVDQLVEVLINDIPVVSHEGGYLPFFADITDAVRNDGGPNQIKVIVTDLLDHRLPWGKQKKDRGGMWYTPVSGIWQTVWIEPVPTSYIRGLTILPDEHGVSIIADIEEKAVTCPKTASSKTTSDIETETTPCTVGTETTPYAAGTETDLSLPSSHPLPLYIDWYGRRIDFVNKKARIEVEDPVLWTPEDPHLYSFSVHYGSDCVRSYCALRTLSIGKANGRERLLLNGKPYFFNGLLDQGYWSDGLYTPPDPVSYEQDILAMKSLGFNTLRKHIKVEAETFYYDCDRLGMIVFQDIVNCGQYSLFTDGVVPAVIGMQKVPDTVFNRDRTTRSNFYRFMEEEVQHLFNHPSICLWTIFNEGWGQFCADAAYDRLKKLDPTRFIDATSGWFRQKRSDVESLHIYRKPLYETGDVRPMFISEYGGYVYKIPEHSFNPDNTYGYKTIPDREAFVCALRNLFEKELLPLAQKGLSAAVYTQVSDVEDETNGFLTYDRRVLKIRPDELAPINAAIRNAACEA